MYQSDTGKPISREVLLKALKRLGELLKINNRRLELVCCGGVVSVLYHSSRYMTQDVDVIFPNNRRDVELLKRLVDEVGAEFGLEHGPRTKWFNDSVNFIGLQTITNTVVFRHSHLVLKAADWHEMIAHKLTAFRGARDINDAICFLKEISSKNKEEVFKRIKAVRPFVPHVADEVLYSRFSQIWEEVHGES